MREQQFHFMKLSLIETSNQGFLKLINRSEIEDFLSDLINFIRQFNR